MAELLPEPNLTIVAGAYSVGLTLKVSDDITVYVGMPPPDGLKQMTEGEAERAVRRNAARVLRATLEDLERS